MRCGLPRSSREGGEPFSICQSRTGHSGSWRPLSGEPVKQLTYAEQNRIATIDAFDDLEPGERWRELVRRVPDLDKIAQQAKASDSFEAWTPTVDSRVGPKSDSDDPVIASVYARSPVVVHILWSRRFGGHSGPS